MTSALARKKIREMLAEDLGLGDVTSKAIVQPNIRVNAEIITKQAGVLAGVAEATMVFEETGVKVRALKSDGADIKAGDVIIRLEGPARGILAAERVALNLLMRMSGIATATRELIDLARRKNSKVVIAATRKTAPLLTYFDKRAVVVAGGEPHRYRLSDQVLIKDNHLRLVGSVVEAVRRARKVARRAKVEVEVSKPEEVLVAAKAGADTVMLDNMKPADIKRAIRLLEREGLRSRVLLEASGRIDTSNVGDFAAAGVDIISSSYMTMRAPALDMSLEIRAKV
ncbi:MAG: carboxylating nicotinate-nucleotide diphosphorylase [Candidatus Hodarchaeaceae archaeon]|nr:carboxylating nicotinate-nucleotide diphosphorylase [Candidatus Hodarchaeaceae archaeon]